MDDVYCPVCKLVISRRGAGQQAPRHCPRCIARSHRLVALLALDQLPADQTPAGAQGDR
ncbi:MAG: RNHCP domain-containing protein [Solirubrobacteraceae bacterium]|jgi:hypothetical protein